MPEKAAAMKALLDAELAEHAALIPEPGGVPAKPERPAKKKRKSAGPK